MIEANQLIKKTKKKFFLYSLIGILLVMIVSFSTLFLHLKNVEKQSSIQEMYSMLTNQLTLVSKISLLSDKFSEDVSKASLLDLDRNYRGLLRELVRENQAFEKWKTKNFSLEIKDVKEVLEDHNTSQRMKLFLKKAKELVNNEVLTDKEVEKNIQYLSKSSREGLGDILILASRKLRQEQDDSLDLLNRMGFVLVSLCILQVLLVWVLVFKPLYSTVLSQHKEISDAIVKVEAANRSKTDFLANISHEIRTPMTAIIGYSDILKRDDVNSFDKNQAVMIIDKNASHLLGLIDEILDISKMEAGKFSFENEEIDLITLINEVYSLINVKAQEKRINLIFKNDGDIPKRIIADSKRLKQVLFNILGNAIKFTEQGAVELSISFKKQSRKLSLIVQDTGSGIPEDKLDKLFKPFEQADSSVTRSYGGTGLGLVLSQGLARGMGGDVRILETKEGKGTTVEILINIGEPTISKLVPTLSTSVIDDSSDIQKMKNLDKVKILVVDDAKENARLFSIYLKEAGAEVVIANDGNSAIGIAKESSFDVILLDLQMAGKDGFQVLKELRAYGFANPIIALTAHAMKEEKDKTKAAGFDDHITKPVKADVLVKCVFDFVNDQNRT